MIIIGYPGIGKSTLAFHRMECIDLESSIFNIDANGSKPDGWERSYCLAAIELSRQGYTVFVSSHRDVVDFLKPLNAHDVYIVCPSKKLKKDWLNKLRLRALTTHSAKDIRAYNRAESHYDEDIDYLESSSLLYKEITEMNYDLEEIVGSL